VYNKVHCLQCVLLSIHKFQSVLPAFSHIIRSGAWTISRPTLSCSFIRARVEQALKMAPAKPNTKVTKGKTVSDLTRRYDTRVDMVKTAGYVGLADKKSLQRLYQSSTYSDIYHYYKRIMKERIFSTNDTRRIFEVLQRDNIHLSDNSLIPSIRRQHGRFHDIETRPPVCHYKSIPYPPY